MRDAIMQVAYCSDGNRNLGVAMLTFWECVLLSPRHMWSHTHLSGLYATVCASVGMHGFTPTYHNYVLRLLCQISLEPGSHAHLWKLWVA